MTAVPGGRNCADWDRLSEPGDLDHITDRSVHSPDPWQQPLPGSADGDPQELRLDDIENIVFVDNSTEDSQPATAAAVAQWSPPGAGGPSRPTQPATAGSQWSPPGAGGPSTRTQPATAGSQRSPPGARGPPTASQPATEGSQWSPHGAARPSGASQRATVGSQLSPPGPAGPSRASQPAVGSWCRTPSRLGPGSRRRTTSAPDRRALAAHYRAIMAMPDEERTPEERAEVRQIIMLRVLERMANDQNVAPSACLTGLL